MKIVTKTLKKNHNVSQESDSSIFLRYIGFFLFLIFLLYLFFISLGHLLVSFISIEDEEKIFFSAENTFVGDVLELSDNIKQRYKDLPYKLHVLNSEEENAFASLGGNIYLTSAFLEQVDSYEALDFIVGHEAGHIYYRDVLRGLATEIPIAVLLSLTGIGGSEKILQSTIGNGFSKYQESRADRYGIDYVYKKNGHIGCSLDFFHAHNDTLGNIVEMFSTHPMTELRIQRLEDYADRKNYEKNTCTTFTYLK